MQRAPHLDEFRARPVGRYLAGRSWLHFCRHAELFGIVFFGRPDRADMEALTRSLLVELDAGVAAHRSLIDARRLAGIDGGAFEVLHAYVGRHHARLRQQVTRLALVRPAGIEGALVAGFYGVLESPYPVEVFRAAGEALAWLGEPSAIGDEVDAIALATLEVEPVVGALRGLLDARLALAVAAAGRALGLSARTLQRRLHGAGTSFQKEVVAARLRAAQRRLLDSDEPLTTIALEVGFSSLQHFSQVFRKRTGESPSGWRAKRRR